MLTRKLDKEFLFEKKLKNRFNATTLTAIKRILYSNDYSMPSVVFYGSNIYKSNHQYASDLDVMEYIQEANPNLIVQRFKSIVKNIRNEKDLSKQYILGDIKCGIDERFMIDVGHTKNMKLINFNAKSINEKLDGLYSQDIINSKQLEYLKSLVFGIQEEIPVQLSKDELAVISLSNQKKYNTDISKYLQLVNQLRKFQILRWKASDIEHGYLNFNNKKFLLKDAITNGMCKFDLIYELTGKYMEVSNTMFMHVKVGKKYYKNMDDDPAVFQKAIKETILDKFYSYNYNFFKGFKLIYTLCKTLDKLKDLKIIYSLLQSDLGKVSKLIAELKSCQSAVEYAKQSNKQYNKRIIATSIFNISEQLNNIYDFKITNIDLFTSIENLTIEIEDQKNIDDGIVIELVQIAIDALMIILNKNTSDLAEKLNLYPLQTFMLP
jgi:hypothetical protein